MSSQETRPFWEGAERGVLLLKHCAACDRPHYYPRDLCPFCFSDRTEWREASGRGRVYSFSVANRASPPYVVAYVRLDEGPMMLTNIVDCPPEAVHIDQPMEVAFAPDAEGQVRPFFRPARPG